MRLEAAIERVERAAAARALAAQGAGPGASAEFEAARAEIRQLRETNQTVSARLDAAIGRMKVLVDE